MTPVAQQAVAIKAGEYVCPRAVARRLPSLEPETHPLEPVLDISRRCQRPTAKQVGACHVLHKPVFLAER